MFQHFREYLKKDRFKSLTKVSSQRDHCRVVVASGATGKNLYYLSKKNVFPKVEHTYVYKYEKIKLGMLLPKRTSKMFFYK